jgi:hypothetical protein
MLHVRVNPVIFFILQCQFGRHKYFGYDLISAKYVFVIGVLHHQLCKKKLETVFRRDQLLLLNLASHSYTVKVLIDSEIRNHIKLGKYTL